MIRLKPNIRTAIDPSRWIALILIATLAIGGAGCGLKKYPLFNLLRLDGSRVNEAYVRGIDYFEQGYYKSAVKELETVPPGDPVYQKAREVLRKAEARVGAVDRHVAHALEHRKSGEFHKAKLEYEAALEVYPRHRRVHQLLEAIEHEIEATVSFYYERSQEDYDRKRFAEARVALIEGLKSDPEDVRLLDQMPLVDDALGNQLLAEGAVHFEKGDFTAAIQRLERAYELLPGDQRLVQELTKVYNRRALKLYREDKLSLAVADLNRSLEIDPGQGEIRSQLEQVKTRMGLLKRIEP